MGPHIRCGAGPARLVAASSSRRPASPECRNEGLLNLVAGFRRCRSTPFGQPIDHGASVPATVDDSPGFAGAGCVHGRGSLRLLRSVGVRHRPRGTGPPAGWRRGPAATTALAGVPTDLVLCEAGSPHCGQRAAMVASGACLLAVSDSTALRAIPGSRARDPHRMPSGQRRSNLLRCEHRRNRIASSYNRIAGETVNRIE